MTPAFDLDVSFSRTMTNARLLHRAGGFIFTAIDVVYITSYIMLLLLLLVSAESQI